MNTRRNLLMMLGAASFAPRVAFTQAKKPILIGSLSAASREEGEQNIAAFKEGMVALGWKEGANYSLEERWADGRLERLPSLAEELAAKRPAVIVTFLSLATSAAAKAAPNIPIVHAQGSSPAAPGLAASLARPGGMMTGVTNIVSELSVKYLELLLAAAPKVKRVGFLLDRKSLSYANHMKNARSAIEQYRVDARFAAVAEAEEIEPAIARLATEGVEALVVAPSGRLFSGLVRKRIVALALAHRWPVVSGSGGRGWAEDGALLSYGADTVALARRAAYYVDRILKGAKPADLPIEQPMTFELVVNLKTAKTLGLTMPPEIMVRATRVIE